MSSTPTKPERFVRSEYQINFVEGANPTAQAVPLDASLHLRPEHPISLVVHGDEQRAVLKFGHPTGPGLHLYLPASEVDKLIQLLTVAACDLADQPIPWMPL
jgi:hypothetical protein